MFKRHSHVMVHFSQDGMRVSRVLCTQVTLPRVGVEPLPTAGDHAHGQWVGCLASGMPSPEAL